MSTFLARPPIVTGQDGLPHCGWCRDADLCSYHKNQVRTGLDTLVSAHTLAGATSDLRFIVRKPPRGYTAAESE